MSYMYQAALAVTLINAPQEKRCRYIGEVYLVLLRAGLS